jgi:hypothetical protein
MVNQMGENGQRDRKIKDIARKNGIDITVAFIEDICSECREYNDMCDGADEMYCQRFANYLKV